MGKNSGQGWTVLLAILIVLVCACSAIGIVGVWSLANKASPLQPTDRTGVIAPSSPTSLIAYVDTDGNIYTIAPDGSGRRAVTRDRPAQGGPYNTLAWSPDGQLAFMTSADHDSALFAVRPGSGDRTQVFSGSADEAPFYLYWSPDSQQLAFLTSSPSRMKLWLAESHHADSAQTIATGSPSYFSWSPDSQSLLMHVGGTQRDSADARVAIFQTSPSETTKLPDAPGSFQAPAWSPDGTRFLLARQNDQGNDELVLAEGDSRSVLASSHTGLMFTWSPRGNRIAFARPSLATGLLFDSVVVLDVESQQQRAVARGEIAAFFWSPDGEQLAVLSIDESNLRPQSRSSWLTVRDNQQSSPVRLAWSVINAVDGTAVDLPAFHPTDSFLTLIPYFDQYAQSLSLWSPDSRYLLYADLDTRNQPAIRVVDTTQPGQPAQRLAEGIFAAWSWH